MKKSSSRVSAVVLGTAALLAVAVPAYAAWQITATNPQAAAKATAVGPVTGVGSTVTSSSVTLTWTAPSGVAPTGYTVSRTSPAPTGPVTGCVNIALTTCTESGLSASTLYSYSIVALRSNWTSTAVTTSATTSAGGTPNFLLTPAAGPYTAGTPFNVTVQARLGAVNDTLYTGNKTLAISAPTAPNGTSSATMTASPVSFNASGQATVSVTLFKAMTGNTFTISDASPATRSGSTTVDVVAGKATLAFTATTVGGSSVTCSPTTAIETGANNTVLATKAVLLSADTWGNAVTLPTSGTVTVTMAISTSSTMFNTFTNATLTINLATSTTSALTYSAKRSNSSAFTGTMTATDGSGTYATGSCALTHV